MASCRASSRFATSIDTTFWTYQARPRAFRRKFHPPRLKSRNVMTKLEVVGVLCVEFFVTKQGDVLINELAPRPHNSGHLTLDAHVTNQFEQQVRTVCGLPLGSTELLRPAAMVNLLGELWTDKEPAWLACTLPDVKLHLYGKRDARPGRKMGHLTALARSPQAATALALEARQRLIASDLQQPLTGKPQTLSWPIGHQAVVESSSPGG